MKSDIHDRVEGVFFFTNAAHVSHLLNLSRLRGKWGLTRMTYIFLSNQIDMSRNFILSDEGGSVVAA